MERYHHGIFAMMTVISLGIAVVYLIWPEAMMNGDEEAKWSVALMTPGVWLAFWLMLWLFDKLPARLQRILQWPR